MSDFDQEQRVQSSYNEDAIFRKLDMLELHIQMMANNIKMNANKENDNHQKQTEEIAKLQSRLDQIEKFEKSVTGSWKGVIFTIVIIWAVVGDKVKALF
jgi:hypothetical protein